MSAQHIGLLLLTSGIALLVACGSDSDKQPESQPDEVKLRFAEWLCPEDPETLEWVDWFNHRRLFSAIGYVPPAEYEASLDHETVPAGAGTQ